MQIRLYSFYASLQRMARSIFPWLILVRLQIFIDVINIKIMLILH